MLFTGTELVCPAGRKDSGPLIVDLGAILTAEARQAEIAFVTPQKAPELLREFNEAWRNLHKLTVQLAAEKLAAERQTANRRAVLLVDTVPSILKEKHLTSNDANRDAIITLDAEYQALLETEDQLTAIVAYLRGKLTSFENAFSAVKKIMSEDTYNMQARQNPNLKGGGSSGLADDRSRPASPPPASPPRSTGFGKARY